MKKSQNLKIEFIARDFNGEYTDIDDCPIARATKRFFNWKKRITVGVGHVTFYGEGPMTASDIIRVVLNNRTISRDGFGSVEYERVKRSFVDKPGTKAHFVLNYEI